METAELHEQCRRFQVCTPETTEKLIKICQEKGLILPKETTFGIEFFHGKGERYYEKIYIRKYYEDKTRHLYGIAPVFSYSELLQFAEEWVIHKNFYNKMKIWTLTSPNYSLEKIGTFCIYDYFETCKGEADLPFWFAEALAKMLILYIDQNFD